MRPRSVIRAARRGSASIEFALTLPIAILLISAVADYGWYLALQTQTLQAVGDGARHGATVSSEATPSPEEAATAHTQTVLAGLGIPCDVEDDCQFEANIDDVGGLQVLRVGVTFNYSPITGLVPNPEKITAETVMAMEDQVN